MKLDYKQRIFSWTKEMQYQEKATACNELNV